MLTPSKKATIPKALKTCEKKFPELKIDELKQLKKPHGIRRA